MNKPIEPQRKGGYSFDWAKNIVTIWWRKHARGFEFLQRVCGIDFDVLVKVLARGGPEWDQLKNIAERHEEGFSKEFYIGDRLYKSLTNVEQLAAIIQICDERMTRSLKNYLTARMNSLS